MKKSLKVAIGSVALFFCLGLLGSGLWVYQALVANKIELSDYLFEASVLGLLLSNIGFTVGLYFILLSSLKSEP